MFSFLRVAVVMVSLHSSEGLRYCLLDADEVNAYIKIAYYSILMPEFGVQHFASSLTNSGSVATSRTIEAYSESPQVYSSALFWGPIHLHPLTGAG